MVRDFPSLEPGYKHILAASEEDVDRERCFPFLRWKVSIGLDLNSPQETARIFIYGVEVLSGRELVCSVVLLHKS